MPLELIELLGYLVAVSLAPPILFAVTSYDSGARPWNIWTEPDHASPTLAMILPLPPQVGQEPAPCLPLPPQSGHVFSAVPGVPAGDSSPGFSGAVDGVSEGEDMHSSPVVWIQELHRLNRW
jgi:hypothetical protein